MGLPTKLHVDSIEAYHRLTGLPAPAHRHVSVIRFEDVQWPADQSFTNIIRDFYIVALKKNVNLPFKYGQGMIDLSGSGSMMHFMAPRQVLSIGGAAVKPTTVGWILLMHEGLFLGSPLANKIRQYEYFSYANAEGLAVSTEEEALVADMLGKIADELRTAPDAASMDILLAQVELVLAYSERFYRRRRVSLHRDEQDEHSIVRRLELFLNDYFRDGLLAEKGIPSIEQIADALHLSSNYLSRVMQSVSGQSTKQYLDDKLISVAREKLSTTELSVSEIAYELGFQSPQSFSKLFKKKSSMTPLAFRASFE